MPKEIHKSFRITEVQNQKIRQKMKLSGVTNFSDFVRRATLSSSETNTSFSRYKDPIEEERRLLWRESSIAAWRSILLRLTPETEDTLRDEIKKAIAQLSKKI